MWTLSRTAKARFLRRLNPKALIVATLVVGGVGAVWALVDLVRLLLGYGASGVPLAALMAPVLLAHAIRFSVIARGWAPVCTHDLTHGNLGLMFGLPPTPLVGADGERGASPEAASSLPLAVQAQLAAHVKKKGWVAWSEVFALHPRPASAVRNWPTWMCAGGWGSGIARRGDWEKALHPSAWRSGALDADLPAAVLPLSPRPRF